MGNRELQFQENIKVANIGLNRSFLELLLTFGAKKHMSATVPESEMHMHNEVIWICKFITSWLAELEHQDIFWLFKSSILDLP